MARKLHLYLIEASEHSGKVKGFEYRREGGENIETIKLENKPEGVERMKSILLVEDETIMRESLQDWLTDNGYEVETAEKGEQALEIIEEQDFGLLILDLKLPGKDGVTVLQEAKQKKPQLKGIIITAYPSVQTVVESFKEGAIDYLTKPFDLNHLEELIQQNLGPVQVEIKPKKGARKAVAKPIVKEEVKEKVPSAPEEIPTQLTDISEKSALIQMLV